MAGKDLPISPLAPKTYAALPPVRGVMLATGQAGIRYAGKTDVLLAVMDAGTQMAGVFTRSLTAAAPVEWCRQNGGSGPARALIVNSGNANAFTGKAGYDAVVTTAQTVATTIGTTEEEVFVCSTGVIGEKLPVEKLSAAIPSLQSDLKADAWSAAADAIRTTDTFPKLATRKAHIGGKEVTINGIAKGSGMIAPDMATMLCFIFTDAALDASVLKVLLQRTAQRTFNCITVDSDTSTNDTVLLFATGAAGNPLPEDAGDHTLLGDFKAKLYELMEDLAVQIVRDGEGAGKLITIDVSGAEDDAAARRIGLAIGNSPLIKTMVAGEDPNWGRVVMAVGKSGEWADRDRLTVTLGDQLAAENGEFALTYDETKARAHLKTHDVRIAVDVGVGVGRARIWTCDLTEQYIRINADYRS